MKPLARRHYDPDLWADDGGPLIAFLGRCGDLAAMKALAARLPQLTPDYRALIIESAIPKEPPHPDPGGGRSSGRKRSWSRRSTIARWRSNRGLRAREIQEA